MIASRRCLAIPHSAAEEPLATVHKNVVHNRCSPPALFTRVHGVVCTQPENWRSPCADAVHHRQCSPSQTKHPVRSCQKRSRTENAPWPSSWSSLEALTARFDSRGYQVDGSLRPRVEGAGRYSSNSLPQLPAVERLPRAKHEVWILGPGPWDLRHPSAAGGRPGSMYRLREACETMPEPINHRRPCVPCRRRPIVNAAATPNYRSQYIASSYIGRLHRPVSRRGEIGSERERVVRLTVVC